MQGLSDIWVLKRNQGFVCALSIIGLPLVTYWLLISATLTLIWFRYSCCIE